MAKAKFVVRFEYEGGLFKKKPVAILTSAKSNKRMKKFDFFTFALREGDTVEILYTGMYPKVDRAERVSLGDKVTDERKSFKRASPN